MPADEHEIVLHNDGTWDPKPHEREQEDQVLDQAENEKVENFYIYGTISHKVQDLSF